jgi:hypothetical protein
MRNERWYRGIHAWAELPYLWLGWEKIIKMAERK